jgi:uncharacterized protein (DUF1499 family)
MIDNESQEGGIMLKLSSAIVLCLFMSCCSGTRPATLGIKDGRLFPCPESPNCVSTQAAGHKHGIDPIRYTGTKEQAKQRLVQVISSMKRSKIIADEGDYLHAEFTSLIFRFVDDVEFSFDDGNKLIHFRSASRLGYSDLGANRKRMEAIRKGFEGASGQ